MYHPKFFVNYYYLPISYSHPHLAYTMKENPRNQEHFLPYIYQTYDNFPYFRQPDTLNVPDSAKTKRVIPIGEEFIIPEFKIAQCNINRRNEYFQYSRGFSISMNQVKREFKNAESSVKEATKKIVDNLNKLIANNDAEIKKLEKEIGEKKAYLHAYLDCPPEGLETHSLCLTPEAQQIIRKIRERERKLKELKSKRNLWGSLDSSRIKFENSLKELAQSEIPNVSWPKNWPTLEDIKYMPVVVQQHLNLPKTLKDMNIDSSLIQDITIPNNIRQMLDIPYDLNLDLDLDLDLKNQIQYDNLLYPAQQVLTDFSNKAIAELQKYNMCFFIKNSPYSLQIKLEYISNFKKFVESYVYGCLEKAKKAALLVFAGYIPTIISSYGASIPAAISNSFATYWTTFKKCLFDVYNAFKKEIENLTNVKSLKEFLQAIEKYVSIDFTLEKRTIPWENKRSLVDLVSNRSIYRNTRQVPFSIDPKEEYIQSEPQFTPVTQHFTSDEEGLIKIINKCGRSGMWIFVTLKTVNSYGDYIKYALNVRNFENNILSGYTIVRTSNGDKVKENVHVPIHHIKNLRCYDPSTDSYDNEKDLFTKTFNADFCSTNKGQFFGKSYIDMDKGIIIYYEVYECGVYTRIYIDGVFKSELYIPRFNEKVKHTYKHSISPISSNDIELDITKKEDELQQRLHIRVYEKLLDDRVNLIFWKIKLPW